jgi:hypothetical protein
MTQEDSLLTNRSTVLTTKLKSWGGETLKGNQGARVNMATGDAAAAAASPPKPTPTARVVRFNVHLVLADAVTKQLRQSPLPTGQLSVNTTDRIVVFTYRRKRAGSFVRTLHAPHKCVVASLSLQIWSRVSKCTVRCRFVDEREKECCLEVLQLMGVRVVDASPMRFVNQEVRQPERVGSSVEQYAGERSD